MNRDTPMALEDSDFSDVGGFEAAYFKLIAEAGNIIKKRSGRTAGGAAVALMSPDELVDHAMGRYRSSPGVRQNRTVYDQLVAYMDDHAHVIQKSPKQAVRMQLSELRRGDKETVIEDFADQAAVDPRSALEAKEDERESQEETDAQIKLIEEIRRAFSKNGIENQIIDVWSQDITKRAEAIKRLNVKASDYDSATKRIIRTKTKLINDFAKKK